MPTCPLCESRHDTENGVAQHIFASKQGDHAEYNDKGQIYRDVIGTESSDNTPDAGGSSADNTVNNNDPARGGPDTGTTAGADTSTEQVGPCPDCGAELVDYRDLAAENVDGQKIATPDDYYCSDCGQGWNE